jgi:hypothetical protein
MIALHDDMAGFMEASSALDWSEPAIVETSRDVFAGEPVTPEKTLEETDALVRCPEEWR